MSVARLNLRSVFLLRFGLGHIGSPDSAFFCEELIADPEIKRLCRGDEWFPATCCRWQRRDAEHGIIERLRSSFRDGSDLVHALAFPLLPQPLLRSLRAEFLPLLPRLPRGSAFCLHSSRPLRRTSRSPCLHRLSATGAAERRSPDHPGDG